jgi:hypothetical protein
MSIETIYCDEHYDTTKYYSCAAVSCHSSAFELCDGQWFCYDCSKPDVLEQKQAEKKEFDRTLKRQKLLKNINCKLKIQSNSSKIEDLLNSNTIAKGLYGLYWAMLQPCKWFMNDPAMLSAFCLAVQHNININWFASSYDVVKKQIRANKLYGNDKKVTWCV